MTYLVIWKKESSLSSCYLRYKTASVRSKCHWLMVSFSKAKFVDMKDGNVELALNIKVHEQKLNGRLGTYWKYHLLFVTVICTYILT